MTPSPDRQEPERETMTIPRLATRVGRSRTLLHRLAANPDEGWPEPTYRTGSTRPEYDVTWFDEYWARRQAGIKQGKRTDLAEKKQGDPMTDTAQQENESVTDADWRVPLKYTRQDLAALLESVEAGRYARMGIADYPAGGHAYVIVQGRGKSIRFNRLRVVDDPQYARDLAAVLLAWADREEPSDG